MPGTAIPIRERTTWAIALLAASDDSNIKFKKMKIAKSNIFNYQQYQPPTRLPSLSKIAIPSRISFHRINGKLTQLAPATAANGTNRPMIGGNFETAAK